ncbi:unnamed protein product, partial [Effrenium voratum]
VSAGSRCATVQVPADAVPGLTRVVVNDEGRIFSCPLPTDAAPRCAIKVFFAGAGIQCQVQWKQPARLRALVPGDAVPGISTTYVRGPSVLQVTVPHEAQPGDTLLIDPDGKEPSQISRQQYEMTAPVPVPAQDDMERHRRLQVVLQEHGGTWNPKIERASTDKLAVPGILARERISKGEVLVRCPPNLLLSANAVRNIRPDFSILVAEVAHAMRFDAPDIDVALQAMFLADLIAVLEEDFVGLGIKDMSKQSVWGAFVRVLLCETFVQHPYRLAAQNPAAFKSLLSPSCEADLIEYLTWGALQWYDLLCARKPLRFSAEQFLRGWLLVMTRAFDVDGTRTTLIPGLDSFNHDPQRVSARAVKDEHSGMLVAATRDIEAGDEVFVVYQSFSISELYRTYGFTLPLEAVPHQTFTVLPSRARAMMMKHLPLSHAGQLIEFHSAMLHPKLANAVQACAREGGKYMDFVREVLQFFSDLYELDPQLQEAIAAKSADDDVLRVKLSSLSSGQEAAMKEKLVAASFMDKVPWFGLTDTYILAYGCWVR